LPLRPFGRLLRILGVILVTAYVLWRARPSAVLDALVHADLRWIGLAVALVVADRALMAYRWIVLLCPIDRASRPALGDVLRIFFLSTFAGTFLPASIGGDLVRAYQLSQLRVAGGQAMASVLMDRLLGVVSILVMGAVGLALARTGDTLATQAIEVPLVVAAALSIAAGAIVFSERAAALAERVGLGLPFEPVRRIATDLTRATRSYGRYHAELANVLAGSIGVQVLRIVQAYCLGRALMIDLPLIGYFTFIPLILLVMLLPVSINGIGPSQIAFVWFFGRVGVADAQSFALSVLFVALGIVGNLPGGLLYAFGSQPTSAKTPAR
jgi:glycosyltransferase 2 family protein